MRTSLECIPCFLRQALEAGRFVTDVPYVHERLLRHVLRLTAEMDLAQCPPVVAREIHQTLRQMTGVADPYRAVKDRFNRMALDMLPEMASMVAKAPKLRARRNLSVSVFSWSLRRFSIFRSMSAVICS